MDFLSSDTLGVTDAAPRCLSPIDEAQPYVIVSVDAPIAQERPAALWMQQFISGKAGPCIVHP